MPDDIQKTLESIIDVIKNNKDALKDSGEAAKKTLEEKIKLIEATKATSSEGDLGWVGEVAAEDPAKAADLFLKAIE